MDDCITLGLVLCTCRQVVTLVSKFELKLSRMLYQFEFQVRIPMYLLRKNELSTFLKK